jgi:archaemetzincin
VAGSFVSDTFDVAFVFDSLRGKYSATEILRRLSGQPVVEGWRLLGVTEADLYIPILTFVLGEAQLGPPSVASALVSIHRLRQEFYGMPADSALLAERPLKGSLHEVGHPG